MKNSMRILYNNREISFHTCPACKINYLNGVVKCDKVIPTFYSEKHAYDEGWRKTSHYLFSKNGHPVWVCPDCWSKIPNTN